MLLEKDRLLKKNYAVSQRRGEHFVFFFYIHSDKEVGGQKKLIPIV